MEMLKKFEDAGIDCIRLKFPKVAVGDDRGNAKVLAAGFSGETNSAKQLLDKLECPEKLYLELNFDGSARQLNERLMAGSFDYALVFGQAPIVDCVRIETIGKRTRPPLQAIGAACDYGALIRILKRAGFKVEMSCDAGTYFCNNVYYYGLKTIHEKNLKTNLMFMHIPMLGDIGNMGNLAAALNDYIMRVRT
jgi:hypothetical protein